MGNAECCHLQALELKNSPASYGDPIEIRPSYFPLEGHAEEVKKIAITPNNSQILSASKNGELKLSWVDTGAIGWMQSDQCGPVSGLSMSDEIAAVAFDNGSVQVYDLDSGEMVHDFTSEASTRCLHLEISNQYLIVGLESKTANIWSLNSGSCWRTLGGHWGAVTDCRLLLSRREALTASDRGRLLLWNIDRALRIRSFVGHGFRTAVNCFTFNADYSICISAGNDKTLQFWDLRQDWERPYKSIQLDESIQTCLLSPNGKYVLFQSQDMRLQVLDLHEHVQGSKATRLDNFFPNSMLFPRDDSRFVVYTSGTKIQLFELHQQLDLSTQAVVSRATEI